MGQCQQTFTGHDQDINAVAVSASSSSTKHDSYQRACTHTRALQCTVLSHIASGGDHWLPLNRTEHIPSCVPVWTAVGWLCQRGLLWGGCASVDCCGVAVPVWTAVGWLCQCGLLWGGCASVDCCGVAVPVWTAVGWLCQCGLLWGGCECGLLWGGCECGLLWGVAVSVDCCGGWL